MEIVQAIGGLLAPLPLFLTVFGTAAGIVVGAIPGLTGAMLIALALPFTFHMAPVTSMILLVSMYTGSITGGLISATLFRIPGTPSNVMTTFDGYPMAVKGEAGRALGPRHRRVDLRRAVRLGCARDDHRSRCRTGRCASRRGTTSR